jgi:hypothetical protein
MALTRPSVVLLIVSLAVTGWLASAGSALGALPAAQAQAAPTPTAEEGSPISTMTIEELQRRKLREELTLLDIQQNRLRQEIELDRQLWRAPTDAIARIGPTLASFGLLYLIARALSHWLPSRPSKAGTLEPLEEDGEGV